jgi:hypothetical protein
MITDEMFQLSLFMPDSTLGTGVICSELILMEALFLKRTNEIFLGI